MLYDSGIVTGRGLPEVDDFGEVGGAAVEADTLHRYHHQYLGCPRRMLKSTNGVRFWPPEARPTCLEVLIAACLGRRFGRRSDTGCSRCVVFYV